MNFPSFGGHFSTTLPAIHQFAAKFSQENVSNSVCTTQETSSKFTDVPSFTQHHHATHRTLAGSKFQNSYINQAFYGQQISLRHEKRQHYEPQEIAQEICAAAIQQQEKHIEKQTKQDSNISERRAQSSDSQVQIVHQSQQFSEQSNNNIGTPSSTTWQSLATGSSTVADYISQLPASSLPLSLHHFLKYSAETIKKESTQLNIQPLEMNIGVLQSGTVNSNNVNSNNLSNNSGSTFTNNLSNLTTINTSQLLNNTVIAKKKKKKKIEKERKPTPKPGEIRLTTALDGSTLYCCPECHMAYPEKELLEQHLVGHTLERRFVCDICGAGLKRKDHLTRHKQSHNPERPYVCTVCLKAFKRKEQLTLHFVIHSGEKRHVCNECGKGFYRKDHLRKHARSHIARRVKAELSQQGTSSPVLQIQVPAPTLTINTSSDIIS